MKEFADLVPDVGAFDRSAPLSRRVLLQAAGRPETYGESHGCGEPAEDVQDVALLFTFFASPLPTPRSVPHDEYGHGRSETANPGIRGRLCAKMANEHDPQDDLQGLLDQAGQRRASAPA